MLRMQLLELLLLRLVIAVVAVVANGSDGLIILEHDRMMISARIKGRGIDFHSRGHHGSSMQQGMVLPAACGTRRDAVALGLQMFLRKAVET